jgi:hypothetical protein
VATQVCQRQPFQIDKHTISAELLKHSKSIQVLNINPSSSRDTIELFFESRKVNGGTIENIDYHDPEHGLADITFEDETGK